MACLAIVGLVSCAEPTVSKSSPTPIDQAPDTAPEDGSIRAITAALAAREALPGRAVYDRHCAICHNGTVKKAPHRLMVGLMTPEAIVTTLTRGLMADQGSFLTRGEQVLVAEYLAGEPMGGEPPATFECAADAAGFDVGQPPRVSGWGLQPTNTRVLPDAVAGIAKTDLDNLKLKWAFAFPGANRARSQPTIAGGAIYVGSHNGLVYALDQDTGALEANARSMRTRFPDRHVQYEVGDYTQPQPLPPLDGIVMANTLHFQPDPVEVVRLCRRYLRPGGQLLRSFAPPEDGVDLQLMGLTVRRIPMGDAGFRQEILVADTLNNRILIFDDEMGLRATFG